MRFIKTISILGFALSNAAFAAGDDVGETLQARGPGALFASIDAAAVDALTYAHLQALESRDTDRIRGGTIYTIGGQYSYREIQRGDPLTPHKILYRFGPNEVARFHAYPRSSDGRTNRINERLSRVDRRSVQIEDPLHRPLYVLHPSLEIGVYSGADARRSEVANLRHRGWEPRFAGN